MNKKCPLENILTNYALFLQAIFRACPLEGILLVAPHSLTLSTEVPPCAVQWTN